MLEEDSEGHRRKMGSRKQETDGEDTGGGHRRRTVASWARGRGEDSVTAVSSFPFFQRLC